MKWLLQLSCVSCLIGLFLYPLFMCGIGSRINWWWETVMALVGSGSLYLLYRLRRSL